VDWFILIIGIGREKDNVSNEWMMRVYEVKVKLKK